MTPVVIDKILDLVGPYILFGLLAIAIFGPLAAVRHRIFQGSWLVLCLAGITTVLYEFPEARSIAARFFIGDFVTQYNETLHISYPLWVGIDCGTDIQTTHYGSRDACLKAYHDATAR